MSSAGELRKEGHKIAGFFYNPNIHPYFEYLKRRSEVERYAREIELNVIYPDYGIERYLQHIVYNEAADKRCPVCWRLRAQETAKFAKENGFDVYTTTLLGSPYQDHDTVKAICADVAKNSNIGFHYKDFRPGFKKAHDEAKAKGVYCQNYCGCIFSEKEKIMAKNEKRKTKT